MTALVTAGKSLVAKASPSHLDEIANVGDLPAILNDIADKDEERLRSAVRSGAQYTLGVVMAHYPEAKPDRITAGFPMFDRNDLAIDEHKILDSVSGYASKLAKAVTIHSTFPETQCPPTPEEFRGNESETAMLEEDIVAS